MTTQAYQSQVDHSQMTFGHQMRRIDNSGIDLFSVLTPFISPHPTVSPHAPYNRDAYYPPCWEGHEDKAHRFPFAGHVQAVTVEFECHLDRALQHLTKARASIVGNPGQSWSDTDFLNIAVAFNDVLGLKAKEVLLFSEKGAFFIQATTLTDKFPDTPLHPMKLTVFFATGKKRQYAITCLDSALISAAANNSAA